uniref:SH3-domain GRB2-like endophilin B1 n=1 Tax=Nothobranchius pienaari TaxID=704102 RepID=A0A1A8MT18_9TELE
MDFNVKRLAADAGTFLSRAVQFTEEKFGQAEKTELDAHLENLLVRAENTKAWTEKIMKQTEVLLQPNPNVRLEEFLYEKLEKKVPTRMNNHELLGQTLIDSGNDFGPGAAYGNALIKCGETQKQIGGAEREFIQSSALNFLTPFRNFLEGDFKTILKERKLLQAEITRLLLEGVSSTHAHHLRCLNDFVEAQTTYYAQCYQYMVITVSSVPGMDSDWLMGERGNQKGKVPITYLELLN